MLSRRGLLLSLAASAGLSACATGPEGSGGQASSGPDGVDMLFISPMGEPFRAKTPAPYPVADWFRGADRNGDGHLDRAEFLADAERFFHVLDVNKDGVIDHREIFYYEHAVVPEILNPNAEGRLVQGGRVWLAAFQPGGMGGMGGRGGGVMGTGAPPPDRNDSPKSTTGPLTSSGGATPYDLLAEPEPVQSSDIRLTGMITLNDFRTRAGQRFELLDADRRGYLTLAGLPETQVERQLPRSARRGLARV